jgi:hypothetical protein
MMSRFHFLALFLLGAVAAAASGLRIGTLNCYLLFDPAIEHAGKVDDANRMTAEQYQTKIANLATLLRGYQIVALQETGGREEIAALGKAAGMSWLWTRGRDTATGQEVGLLHNLPGWKVIPKGRIAELDRVVSKHLLLHASRERESVYMLAVHLLRPIGAQAERQARQRQAIGDWARTLSEREPRAVVVIAGDTNFSDRQSVYGLGRDAGELNGYAATHLAGRCIDRLVVVGPGSWSHSEIRRPPFGTRPNEANKLRWTDHYFVGATLVVE